MKTDIASELRKTAAFLEGGPFRAIAVAEHETQKRWKRISTIKDASEGDILTLIKAPGVRGKLILSG